MTQRQNLEVALRLDIKKGKSQDEINKRFKELVEVELVEGTEYLLAMFDELHETRAQGLNGASAISYSELQAYCELMDEMIDPWEVGTLKAMDRALLDESEKFPK